MRIWSARLFKTHNTHNVTLSFSVASQKQQTAHLKSPLMPQTSVWDAGLRWSTWGGGYCCTNIVAIATMSPSPSPSSMAGNSSLNHPTRSRTFYTKIATVPWGALNSGWPISTVHDNWILRLMQIWNPLEKMGSISLHFMRGEGSCSVITPSYTTPLSTVRYSDVS